MTTQPNSYSPRSPELMSRGDTALLVVDMQEKLLPAIIDRERIIFNTRRLMAGAKLLSLPIFITEQYPQGLGQTVAALVDPSIEALPKRMFSCRECASIGDQLLEQRIGKVLISGIESHVCVQQTAIDFIAAGFRVYLAVDALGARGELDHRIALERMNSAGITLTTTEAALFEWCETSSAAEFKDISALVRETCPVDAVREQRS